MLDVIKHLKSALEPDYVVLGAGNARKIKDLPPDAHICPNENVFAGGFRLWEA